MHANLLDDGLIKAMFIDKCMKVAWVALIFVRRCCRSMWFLVSLWYTISRFDPEILPNIHIFRSDIYIFSN